MVIGAVNTLPNILPRVAGHRYDRYHYKTLFEGATMGIVCHILTLPVNTKIFAAAVDSNNTLLVTRDTCICRNSDIYI